MLAGELMEKVSGRRSDCGGGASAGGTGLGALRIASSRRSVSRFLELSLCCTPAAGRRRRHGLRCTARLPPRPAPAVSTIRGPATATLPHAPAHAHNPTTTMARNGKTRQRNRTTNGRGQANQDRNQEQHRNQQPAAATPRGRGADRRSAAAAAAAAAARDAETATSRANADARKTTALAQDTTPIAATDYAKRLARVSAPHAVDAHTG